MFESIVAGLLMLTWPLGAYQFANADLLDELKLGTRVCEGKKKFLILTNLAQLVV